MPAVPFSDPQNYVHVAERLAAEQAAAEKSGTSVEALFDGLIEDIPPGSQGLMLQPFWTPGIRTPGPEAKGAVIGFGDVHPGQRPAE